jgi:hypothetical protein
VAEDVLAGIVERGERGLRGEEGAKEVFWGFGRTVFAPESAAALSKGLQKGISGGETTGEKRSPPDRLAKQKMQMEAVFSFRRPARSGSCGFENQGAAVAEMDFAGFPRGALVVVAGVGSLVVGLLARPKQGWVLAMDRTNWKFGRKHVNILSGSLFGRSYHLC